MAFISNYTFNLIWSAQILYAWVVGININKKVKACKLLTMRFTNYHIHSDNQTDGQIQT